ncbi:DUF3800 domain-containing protein [Amycolatopsis magusensis]|uniref:DUF3800 domain-containing protein n=1 Tax=Amycolatopsis magusensis TaxID=882444 RepID=UPI003C2B189A
MYLLFLDESGTHQSSPCLIVAGFAIHEHDAYHLQKAIGLILDRNLGPLGFEGKLFELHANEVKNPEGKRHKHSPWHQVDYKIRRKILAEAYKTLSNFHVYSSSLPIAAFGVVVDKRKTADSIQREQLAYELILNKFDAMLGRLYRTTGERQRGLVVHDERVVAERDIQEWTDSWREAAGAVGQLTNFAEVPLFADSRQQGCFRLPISSRMPSGDITEYQGMMNPSLRICGLFLIMLMMKCMA